METGWAVYGKQEDEENDVAAKAEAESIAATDWNTRPIEDALRAELAHKDELIEALREVAKTLENYAEILQLNQYTLEEFNDTFARDNINRAFVAVLKARARLEEVEKAMS